MIVKYIRDADEQGLAVILKNNKPRYVVVDFNEYDQYKASRDMLIQETENNTISENLEAFKELAK